MIYPVDSAIQRLNNWSLSICREAPNLALTYKYLHSLACIFIYLHVSKFTTKDLHSLINKHLHSRIRLFIHSDTSTPLQCICIHQQVSKFHSHASVFTYKYLYSATCICLHLLESTFINMHLHSLTRIHIN